MCAIKIARLCCTSKMGLTVRYRPWRGSQAAIMFLASNICWVSSGTVRARYCWLPRDVSGAKPGMKKCRRGNGTMLTASLRRSAFSYNIIIINNNYKYMWYCYATDLSKKAKAGRHTTQCWHRLHGVYYNQCSICRRGWKGSTPQLDEDDLPTGTCLKGRLWPSEEFQEQLDKKWAYKKNFLLASLADYLYFHV